MKEEEEDIDDSLKQSGGGSELLKARKRYESSASVFSLSENKPASEMMPRGLINTVIALECEGNIYDLSVLKDDWA